MKIIDLILSNIVKYEKNILAVDYINQTIETKEKWNQINVLSMESMLGANCCMSLLHMSKSYIWIEETSERINEFSFGHMFNSTLYTIKIIDLILSNIVIYEKNISAEDYINQAIETKDKWNQINVLSTKSMFGGQLSYAIITYVKKLPLD